MCRVSEASSLGALAEALDEITHARRAGSAPPADPTPAGARRIYGALCLLVVKADRRSIPARGRVLESWRKKLVVPPEDAQLIAALARQAKNLRLGQRPRELALLLEGLVEVATAGGVAPTPRDELILWRVAQRVGWTRARVGAAIAKALNPAPRELDSSSETGAVLNHKATRADVSGSTAAFDSTLAPDEDARGRTDVLPAVELPRAAPVPPVSLRRTTQALQAADLG